MKYTYNSNWPLPLFSPYRYNKLSCTGFLRSRIVFSKKICNSFLILLFDRHIRSTWRDRSIRRKKPSRRVAALQVTWDLVRVSWGATCVMSHVPVLMLIRLISGVPNIRRFVSYLCSPRKVYSCSVHLCQKYEKCSNGLLYYHFVGKILFILWKETKFRPEVHTVSRQFVYRENSNVVCLHWGI